MRVLVTGSAGFLGSHLTARLLGDSRVSHVTAAWHNKKPLANLPSLPDRYWADLRVADHVRVLLKTSRPDVIFHLAGNPLVKDAGPSMTIDNALTTHFLLEHAPAGCRFVFASSATVYGDTFGRPARECFNPEPTSVYAASKLYCEHLVRTYSQVVGTSLRLVATVGPHATHGLIPDLVRKLREPGDTIRLFGARPGSVKPFVHVDDVVDAFLLAAFSSDWTDIEFANISNFDSISVEEVAKIGMEVIGVAKRIQWDEKAVWKGDNPAVSVDSGLARLLGWKPECTSTGAVRKAIEQLWASPGATTPTSKTVARSGE